MTEELRKQLNEESEAFQNIFEEGEIGCGKKQGEKLFIGAKQAEGRKEIEEANKDLEEKLEKGFQKIVDNYQDAGRFLIKTKEAMEKDGHMGSELRELQKILKMWTSLQKMIGKTSLGRYQ